MYVWITERMGVGVAFRRLRRVRSGYSGQDRSFCRGVDAENLPRQVTLSIRSCRCYIDSGGAG